MHLLKEEQTLFPYIAKVEAEVATGCFRFLAAIWNSGEPDSDDGSRTRQNGR